MEAGAQENKEAENTPEAILRSTAEEYNKLDLEATAELHVQRNSRGYNEKMRTRAQLIVDLPDKIIQAQQQGQEFPEIELRTLLQFSGMAQEALKSDESSFLLGSLLDDHDSKVGDLNNLEKLIERVYPAKPVAETSV